MELSALFTATVVPLLIGLTPIAAVRDMVWHECPDRHKARPAVKAKPGKPDYRHRHYILM